MISFFPLSASYKEFFLKKIVVVLLIAIFWLCHHTNFRKSGDLSLSYQVELCKSFILVRVTAAV